MDRTDTQPPTADVAVVGGGPAGCAAAVFTARYGLETVVFDRGRSSLRRCAVLENYPGFPAGIDVDTFSELLHDHVEEAGGEIRSERVAAVTRGDSTFRIETEDESMVAADRVIAATKYGAPYLTALSDVGLFTDDAAGETPELDTTRIVLDGHTPVEGLYVAGPLGGAGDQAIIAAGHGATVARTLLTDIREGEGYWDEIAEPYDWVRRLAELPEEWDRRERWHEWFETHSPPEDLSPTEIDRLREAHIDRSLGMYIDQAEVDRRTDRAQRALAAHLDEDVLLDVLPDERIRAYAREVLEAPSSGGDGR